MEQKLGGSLPVPIVQELAKEKLATVPPRYVRLDQHQQTILSNSLSSFPQIPVIDMQKLSDEYSMDSELEALNHACQEWGFFQLINHGVESSVVEKMKLEVQEFFNLPIEEKNKFMQKEEDIEGYGHAFVVSEEQKLDWGDMFFVRTLPTQLRNPYLIPNLPPTFRDAIEVYATELKILATKILKLMAKALDIKAEEMKTVFAEGVQSMRMNYYPPCPQPELVTGLCPHSDAVGLTILLQANEMEGLQIKKDGVWIPVSPLPNAFVINIGDILEIVTNGAYRSIEHRATVNSTKERLSIATFLSPNDHAHLGPAASLVTPQTPAKFKTIGVAEYFKGLISRELVGKSYVDLMRI
ncbi:protein SRG1 [Sesamum angolense]|uniref:Protein SRG1 n=1 Tax=Sesamum angolense TaxID=2727404 RepID=A0AAE2BIG0_9LAMI|nr:protein SRG1 [Sesamum angolense]